MEEQKKVVCPIAFGKDCHVKPIAFEDSGKPQEQCTRHIVKPIRFIMHEQQEDGTFRDVLTEDERLAHMIIPHGVPIEVVIGEKGEMLKHDKYANLKNGIVRAEGKENTENSISISEVANYELFPLKLCTYVNSKGEILYDSNEIEVRIVIEGQEASIFTIKYMQIDSLTKIVGKRYPHAVIYDKKACEIIEVDFRKKVKQAVSVRRYVDAGWQNINNKYYYLYSGRQITGAEVITNLSLPINHSITTDALTRVWGSIRGIYREEATAAVLSLYSILGVLYRLFCEAGFPPHFLLFMTGKTGSFKTTVAKILFTQLCDERFRDCPRRIDADTSVSLERGIVQSGRDTITLIDDYSPAKSRQSAAEISAKLEAIIRMVGDGSTKSRSNVALDDIRGEGVAGMVVLTGELHGKGLSSNLRCLFCEIQRELVDLDCVTFFQKNPDLLTSYIYHFTNFLSARWKSIVELIGQKFDLYRENIEAEISARRLVDAAVTLWIAADIVQWFLVDYCRCTQDIAVQDTAAMKKSVITIVKRSEMLSEEDDPSLMFMKALIILLDRGEIKIANGKPKKSEEMSFFDGFTDGEYIYIDPHCAYREVKLWMQQGGIYWTLDETQIAPMLCREGYALSSSNGTNKQTYYARVAIDGKKQSFLKFGHAVIDQLHDSNY